MALRLRTRGSRVRRRGWLHLGIAATGGGQWSRSSRSCRTTSSTANADHPRRPALRGRHLDRTPDHRCRRHALQSRLQVRPAAGSERVRDLAERIQRTTEELLLDSRTAGCRRVAAPVHRRREGMLLVRLEAEIPRHPKLSRPVRCTHRGSVLKSVVDRSDVSELLVRQ